MASTSARPSAEVAAAYHLQDGTVAVVLRPSGAHLCRILRAVYTVVTLGTFAPVNPEHNRTEVAVSDNDLRQTKRVDAVASLQPHLK